MSRRGMTIEVNQRSGGMTCSSGRELEEKLINELNQMGNDGRPDSDSPSYSGWDQNLEKAKLPSHMNMEMGMARPHKMTCNEETVR